MTKKLSIIIILIVSFIIGTTTIYGDSLRVDDPRIKLGKVVEVIDGEVVRVLLFNQHTEEPVVKIVKMIGIDTDASVDAFSYTSNRLLGQNVYLVIEDEESYGPQEMIHANLYYSFDKTVSEELLELGFAKVDSQYKKSSHYQSFLVAQDKAKVYDSSDQPTHIATTVSKININTASFMQLQEILDLSPSNANRVKNYRRQNPFSNITEIMAVHEDLDSDWFDDHKYKMSVITNMNRASYLELSSLIGITSNNQEVLDDLEYYLRFHEVDDINELKEIKSFEDYYDKVDDYMTLKYTNIYVDDAKMVVNINTCNSAHFTETTGLSVVAYNALIDLRKKNNYITTIGELYKGDKVFPSSLKYHYTDELNAYTNINTATEYELISLLDQTAFGYAKKKEIAKKIVNGRPYYQKDEVEDKIGEYLYNYIDPYIYLYPDEIPDSYNIHTISPSSVSKMNKRYNGIKTNYSNINILSRTALMDIHKDMTKAIVDDIIEYREKHPFRFHKDLETIFKKRDKFTLYEKIENYIVFE